MGNGTSYRANPTLSVAFLHMVLLFTELLADVFSINNYLINMCYTSF